MFATSSASQLSFMTMLSHSVRIFLFYQAVAAYRMPSLHRLVTRPSVFVPDFPIAVPEITRIWRRPKTRGSYLFLLNRYFGFFGGVTVTVLNFCAMPRET